MDSSCVGESHLWKPHLPGHEDLEISSLLPPQPPQDFEQLVNIDFGGTRGLLLGSLTRIAFHMASSPCPLIGIEICYSDGKSIHYGSHGGCGISFFIDGPRGERINQIGILEQNSIYHPAMDLTGLQVFFPMYSPSTFLYDVNSDLGLNKLWANSHFRSSLLSTQRKC